MNTITNQLKFNSYSSKPQKQDNSKANNSPAFKACVFNRMFKFLADEPVWGATIIDIASMVVPRTWTDWKKRGFNAGFETGFRESESSANDAFAGLYGVAAGTLIATAINKKYNVKAHDIFASTDASDVYSAKWNKYNGDVDKYTEDIVDSIRAYNPNSALADEKGFIKIPEEHKPGILEDLRYIAKADKDEISTKWKEVKERLHLKILNATGTEKELKLVHNIDGVEKATVSNSKTLLENFYQLTNAFKSNKVVGKVSQFINEYKTFGKYRTALGISIAAFFAVAAQPFNVYLSKKRTGSDGFVGVEGRQKDNSKEFKLLKVCSSIGMIGIALASMGALSKNPLKIPKLFIEKNQYKGKCPTINQFKTIFGLAIASRLLTSRDQDEHREVITKDVLGFFNWLILGNVFNQLILKKFQAPGANLLKRAPLPENAGKIKRICNFLRSSIATHTEVVMEGLKKEKGMTSFVKPNGKAMAFNEMYNLLEKGGQTRKNLRLLNAAQFFGYLYSGLVLGIGIPNLNIYLTSLSDKRRKAKLEKMKQVDSPVAPTIHSMKTAHKQVDKTIFGQFKRDIEAKRA